MQRDMELIRAILMSVEDESGDRLQNYEKGTIAYHVQLLIDAGLCEGWVRTQNTGSGMTWDAYAIHRLTWQGHDFLDSVKDDGVWKKAKAKVLKPGAAWTFEILKAVLKAEIAKRLALFDG